MKQDGKTKYGGFVYFCYDGCCDCLEELSGFSNNKKELKSYLSSIIDFYKSECPEEPIEAVLVEMWKGDGELWGNTGEPIYHREISIKR